MSTKLEDALEFLQCVHFPGNSCILASLSVKEFLRRIDIKANVKSVGLALRAYDGVIPLHTLGVGMNKLWDQPYKGTNWDGHMVVTVPGYIIDMTFHQARRWAWEWIGDVAVVPRESNPLPLKLENGQTLPVIARMGGEKDSYRFEACWISNTNNKSWRDCNDYKDPSRRKEHADDLLVNWNRYLGERK